MCIGIKKPMPHRMDSSLFLPSFCTLRAVRILGSRLPLDLHQPQRSTKYDVLGTLLLSILAGHNRYAHITALRSDGVSPEVLKMNKIISEDAMRRGLARIDAPASEIWLKSHLMRSLSAALNTPWILDIDTTIKVLYGNQQGAEVGYNPTSLDAPAMRSIPTGWVICAWCWMSWSALANNSAHPMHSPA